MDPAGRRLSRAIQLATLELKLHSLVQRLERCYAPDQPRVPAGNPDGGQWTDGRGGGAAKIALAARLHRVVEGFDGPDYIRQCIYIDIFGRQFGFEVPLTQACPKTYATDRYPR